MLASAGLIYTDTVISLLGRIGLAQFVGAGKDKDKKNKFRLLVVIGTILATLFVFGGDNIRFGSIGIICGILIVYYSRQIARVAGSAIPSPSGVSSDTVINIAGVIITIVSILWLLGIFSPLTQESVNIVS